MPKIHAPPINGPRRNGSTKVTYQNRNSRVSGATGLVDRVFAVHTGSRGFDSHRRHMSECFFSDPIDRDIRTQYVLSWKKGVSEWQSVIAVLLNVSGGVRLIKPAKLYMCKQKHYKHNEDGHMELAFFVEVDLIRNFQSSLIIRGRNKSVRTSEMLFW